MATQLGPAFRIKIKTRREGMKTILVFLVIGNCLSALAQSGRATPTKSVEPFALSISSKPVVALGSPVEIRVRLTNKSTHDINGSTMHNRGFCPSYVYDIRDQSGNAVQQKESDQAIQGSLRVMMLKPGESRDETTTINEMFDLWPGTYTVQLSKPVSDAPGADVVKSNKITITITP
jgi:hypothetical protein